MAATIKIDFDAGSSIDLASADAVRIANLLGIGVEFSFNEVECLALPNGDATHLAKRYMDEVTRKLAFPRDTRRAITSPRHIEAALKGEPQ